MASPPIERIESLPYRLPLARPWHSARGALAERHGWLVRVAAQGIWGYGDCAPLPEAGTETAAAAERALAEGRERLGGQRLDVALARLSANPSAAAPAADWAVECALLDLESRLLGLPLRRLLRRRAADKVPVNGMLGALGAVGPDDLAAAAEQGWRVLKLKVGVADPGSELVRLAELIRHLPPGLRLRLDANGAWDGATSQRMVRALSDWPREPAEGQLALGSPVERRIESPVEALEEPLADPDRECLARLQSIAPFALALDESLTRFVADGGAARLPVRRAVLKPAALGGLRRTLALAERLAAAGREVVVTGLVDSAAGLWPTAQLAAALGSALPHGLATAGWLAADLGPAPEPSRGLLALPETPGSGFDPFPA